MAAALASVHVLQRLSQQAASSPAAKRCLYTAAATLSQRQHTCQRPSTATIAHTPRRTLASSSSPLNNSAQSTSTSKKVAKHKGVPKHVLTISDLNRQEIVDLIALAQDIRHVPQMYESRLKQKSLIMLFEKPSLRTRLSFEVGMTQLGGHAIYYELGAKSNLGSKETVEDTARVISRFGDIIMARINSRETLRKLAEWSSIPVINALDDFGHPCQILCDVQAIVQKFGGMSVLTNTDAPLTIAFVGDIANNVTYDWMRVAAILGWKFRAAGPKGKKYAVEEEVSKEIAELSIDSGADVMVTHDAVEAVKDADVVMTDSWMSYHLNKEEQQQRFADLDPYRVTADLMKHAKKSAVFMHCLPVQRGAEVTAEVVDGEQSIIFDQTENRLHAQKALMLYLLQEKRS